MDGVVLEDVVEVSADEMVYFNPATCEDFNNEGVIAIKFLAGPDEDSLEETSWFINPIYRRGKLKELAPEYIPELLLVGRVKDDESSKMEIEYSYQDFNNLLDDFSSFNLRLLASGKENLSDNEKLELFYEECRQEKQKYTR